jgi:hypothetical protein
MNFSIELLLLHKGLLLGLLMLSAVEYLLQDPTENETAKLTLQNLLSNVV